MKTFITFIFILLGILKCTADFVDPGVEEYERYLQYTKDVASVPLDSVPSTRVEFNDTNGIPMYLDQLSSPACGTDSKKTYAEMEKAVALALPNLAWQYGLNVSDAQNLMRRTNEITDMVIAAMTGQDYTETACLQTIDRKRWFWNKIVNFVKEIFVAVSCSTISSAALPAYIALKDVMYVYHTVGKATSQLSDEQKFFVQAAHGRLVDQEYVKFYFNAGVITIFSKNVVGITFGRNVYLTGSQISSYSAGASAFYDQVDTLIHELQHVRQYRNFGFVAPAFGLQYLYHYCSHGFSYNDIEEEVEARDKSAQVLAKLVTNYPQFFTIWRTRHLVSAIGFPLNTNVEQVTSNVVRLSFDNGVLEVNYPCYKILPFNYYQAKNAATCSFLSTTTPTSCHVIYNPFVCDPVYIAAWNAQCQKDKNAWGQMQASIPPYTC